MRSNNGERRYTDLNGYIVVSGESSTRSKHAGLLEHRVVMEKILGRELLKTEQVHHINGIRCDNRPENLELWSKSHPSGQRIKDLVEWAKQIIELYNNIAWQIIEPA